MWYLIKRILIGVQLYRMGGREEGQWHAEAALVHCGRPSPKGLLMPIRN